MIDNGQQTEQCSLIRHRDKEVCSQLTSSHFDVMGEKLTGPCFVRWWWHLSPPGSVVTGQSEVLNQRVNTVYVGTGYQQSGCAPPGQVSSHFRWWRPRLGQECPSSSPHTGHAGYIYTSSPLSSPCHHYLHHHDHITIIIIMTTLS